LFNDTYVWYLGMLAGREDLSSVLQRSGSMSSGRTTPEVVRSQEEIEPGIVMLSGGPTNWEAWEPYSIPSATYQVVTTGRRLAHQYEKGMMEHQREIEIIWKLRRLAGR